MRDRLGLKKSTNKLSNTFEAHCVDSWVLANFLVDGHDSPDNKEILLITPLRFHRRQLHVFNFAKNGIRKRYGGTRSLGFKRGSLVKHIKHGLCFVGGASNGRISLHNISDGKRITQNTKTPGDVKFLTFNGWRWAHSSPQ